MNKPVVKLLKVKAFKMGEKRVSPESHTQLPAVTGFENVDYRKRITMSKQTDKRLMSFVDNLWGFEVTGGCDQYEPLTVIAVRRCGLARRAGIRVNDVITKINETRTGKLKLLEAQEMIRKSGRSVKIYVYGEEDEEAEDQLTADFWFKPLKEADLAFIEWERRLKANRNPDKWNGVFPWNDKKKIIYKESNCCFVPSEAEQKRQKIAKLNVTQEEYDQHLANEEEAKVQAEAKLEAGRIDRVAEREESMRNAQQFTDDGEEIHGSLVL